MKASSKQSLGKWFGIIFLVVLVGLLIVKIAKEGIYSAGLGMNIAVVGNHKIGLLLLRPEEDVVGWVSFPDNIRIKIFNSEAQYPIVSLWEYGVLEKNPYEMVEKSLGLSIGVPIARTIKVTGDATVEEVLAELHRVDLKTDLSLRDRFLIRQFLVALVASKKVLGMDIPAKIFDQTVDPDGKTFLSFNAVASLWTKNKFVLDSILGENVDLIVNNLSGQAGFGTQVAKQLESAGMRVVAVKSDATDDIQGKGCLFNVVGKFPFTESLLVDQMKCVKRTGNILQTEKGITVWLK